MPNKCPVKIVFFPPSKKAAQTNRPNLRLHLPNKSGLQAVFSGASISTWGRWSSCDRSVWVVGLYATPSLTPPCHPQKKPSPCVGAFSGRIGLPPAVMGWAASCGRAGAGPIVTQLGPVCAQTYATPARSKFSASRIVASKLRQARLLQKLWQARLLQTSYGRLDYYRQVMAG